MLSGLDVDERRERLGLVEAERLGCRGLRDARRGLRIAVGVDVEVDLEAVAGRDDDRALDGGMRREGSGQL